MRLRLVLAYSAALLTAAPASAEVYKWTDAAGAVHYGDRTAAGHGNGQPVPLPTINSYGGAEVQRVDAALGEQLALSNASATQPTVQPTVQMYSTSWCGVCRKARAYFQQNHIHYTDYDVETSDQGRRAYQQLGGRGVPIVLVGRSRINGFDANTFESLYRTGSR